MESGQVPKASGGIAKTVSPIAGSTQKSEKLSMTDESRKDERRDRFDRKKKFKKSTSASHLKKDKQKANKKRPENEH